MIWLCADGADLISTGQAHLQQETSTNTLIHIDNNLINFNNINDTYGQQFDKFS